jgi:hypothetical protein
VLIRIVYLAESYKIFSLVKCATQLLIVEYNWSYIL